MPARPSSSVTVPEHVLVRTFVAETVVLNLQTQRFHGLNPTAGRMIEVLGRLGTPEKALAVLAEDYGRPPEQLEPSLLRLVDDLVERGLLVIDDGA